MTPQQAFTRLLKVQRRLLAPGGCPWDRKQTPRDIKTYLLEEVYEVLQAIDLKHPGKICEELGDLAFQILFLAALYERPAKKRRKGKPPFTLADVFNGIADKLVRRHPHVFGKSRLRTADQVLTNWERLKSAERREKDGHRASVLDGVPPTLPALLAAFRLTGKAARVGFDWERVRDIAGKLEEETRELVQALRSGRKAHIRGEFGDLLFVMANLARRLDVDPEQALQGTNAKFIRRFKHIEQTLARRGKRMDEATLPEMDALWDDAKRRERRKTKRRGHR